MLPPHVSSGVVVVVMHTHAHAWHDVEGAAWPLHVVVMTIWLGWCDTVWGACQAAVLRWGQTFPVLFSCAQPVDSGVVAYICGILAVLGVLCCTLVYGCGTAG